MQSMTINSSDRQYQIADVPSTPTKNSLRLSPVGHNLWKLFLLIIRCSVREKTHRPLVSAYYHAICRPWLTH